jgi:phosphotransferase system enzyme I (PtsI)
MAGDITMTRLLLAFGLRLYSMHTAHLLDVKQIIRKSNCSKLKPLAWKMLRATNPENLYALLDKLNSI